MWQNAENLVKSPHILLWRRKWQPTPVFSPGEFHGQRSLVGHGPWDGRVRHDLVTKQHHQHPDIHELFFTVCLKNEINGWWWFSC